MRILKLAIISFLFFALLITLMSLLVPSQVRISKAINLSPTDTAILQQVQDTANWVNWHPAFQNNRAAGQLIQKQLVSDSLVVINIIHQSGNAVQNSWALHRFGTADSLTLQWFMDFRLSWLPWHKFSSLFYEGTYGRMMEQGLINLKQLPPAVYQTK